MRSKKIWGSDTKLFRPERWLEGSAEDRRRTLRLRCVLVTASISALERISRTLS
jgi:hypothetical protein